VIALPPWVAVCCFFRYSKSHGYAAVVAAFTAVVIVLGTFNSRQQGADAPLARIQVYTYPYVRIFTCNVRCATLK
jgi:hypothetical protein